MLREIFILAAFLLILSEIVGGIVVIEKASSRHMSIVENIIEDANETF